jgi:hypothetical protein
MERQDETEAGTPFMRVVANPSKTQFNANWVLLSLPKSIASRSVSSAADSVGMQSISRYVMRRHLD